VIRLEQVWSDRDGQAWTVRQVHRKDWLAEIQSSCGPRRCVLFSELGRDYRPVDP
jgi:hypothetical protein